MLQSEPSRLTGRHIALLALLMACGFIVVGQLYVTIPMVTGIAAGFGIDPASAALIGTAFGIAYAAGFLALGPLSDRYGRKRMVLIGLVATAAATALVGLANSFGLLLAGRAVQGLAASIFPPVALSLVTEELPPGQRPLGVSLMSFAFLGAAPLSQLFAAETGGSLSTIMFELAPLYLLGAVGLSFVVAGKNAVSGAGASAAGGSLASLFQDRGIVAAWAAAVTVLFGFVSFYSGMQAFGPSIGVDLQTVRLIGLPPLLLTFATAPVTRRFGAAVTARLGLTLAALAIGIGTISTPAAMMVASALLSGGVAFAVPGLIATVAGRATNANRGLALAIYSFALFLGASFAPPIAQALAGTGLVPLLLLPAALLLAAVAALMCSDVFGEKWGSFRIAHLATGDRVGVEIFEFSNAERPANNFEYWKSGIFHFCVQDPDVEGLAEKIVAAGGKQRMPVREYFPGEKPYRMVYMEDPFGNIIEIYSHSYELTYSAGAYE